MYKTKFYIQDAAFPKSDVISYLMVCNDAISLFLKYLMKQHVILSNKKHIKQIEKT